jgi:hypothetical protein
MEHHPVKDTAIELHEYDDLALTTYWRRLRSLCVAFCLALAVEDSASERAMGITIHRMRSLAFDLHNDIGGS